MTAFDLSKITGNEPPLETDADKDAEIQRLREALAASEAGAAELWELVRRGRSLGVQTTMLEGDQWSTFAQDCDKALSSTDAGKRVLAVVEAAKGVPRTLIDELAHPARNMPASSKLIAKMWDALDAMNQGGK